MPLYYPYPQHVHWLIEHDLYQRPIDRVFGHEIHNRVPAARRHDHAGTNRLAGGVELMGRFCGSIFRVYFRLGRGTRARHYRSRPWITEIPDQRSGGDKTVELSLRF